MKILWVTPKWTLPASDGARVASKQLIKALTSQNLSIDYLSFSHPEDNEDPERICRELGVESADYVKRILPRTSIQKFIYYGLSFLFSPTTPLTTVSFTSSELKRKSKEILKAKKYDFIVADGLHAIVPFLNLDCKLIYRSHNVEYDIWKRASENSKNPVLKFMLYLQYLSMRSFENRVIDHVDYVFPISDEDRSVYLKNHSGEKIMTVPLGLEFKSPSRTQSSGKIRYLFLGRLDWPPNRDGLQWLLDKVWPSIDKNKYELIIAGSGNSDWMEDYEDMDGVQFEGFVSDLDDLYSRVDASLIPIFYGSGTRIKVIEAASKSVPILSTKMGAMGSGLVAGEHFIQAENPEEWIRTLNGFDREASAEMAGKTFLKLKQSLDSSQIAQNLIQKLL